MKKYTLGAVMLCAVANLAFGATPTVWTTNYDAATYGSTGTVTFNDWGYKGPTGVGANDFKVGAGFDASRVGQRQTVVTTGPDGKTSDAGKTILSDAFAPTPYVATNANMDSQVNFFKWAYTTVAGSTFNNMEIDKAGNYKVAKSDMNFQFYDTFQYQDKTGVNPSVTYDTGINFQPYAISDAKGWCGSVLTSNPNGLEKMAGQVTFDFAFDAYLNNGKPGIDPSTTQIVPGFVMRSYGDYTVNVTGGGGYTQSFSGSAVGNNTNPESIVQGVGGTLDPAYLNKVSFLGAGVIPKGLWVFNEGSTNVTVAETQGTAGTSGQIRADGAVWHQNSFAGYAFLLRADGQRILTYINPTGHSDYVATVPVPAAAWLLGSGLMGLVGVARRKIAA